MYHNINHKLCKQVNRVRLKLIMFGHASVGSEWNGTIASPVYSRLYYIAGGVASITTNNGERIKLEVGKWYLIPTGCSFEYECSEEMEHFYFHLKLCDFDGTDLLRKCRIPLDLELKNNIIDFMSECINSENVLNGLLLQQRVFEVLISFLDVYGIDIKTENYSPCVMRAVKYIKDNLSVKLTISEIAENAYISKSALTKHFQKELSMSVNEYIYDLVMSGAEYMLTASDISIQEISEKFGFYDQFYFSRRFKEKFGQTPSEYRKSKPL